MKILVLENEPSSRRGGQELSLLDVCRGLAQHGHQIDLVYTFEGDLLEQYRTFCRSLIKVERYTVERSTPVSSLAGVTRGLFRLLPSDTDLIYINDYHDALFSGMLARLKRVPLVCHLRLFPPGTFCGQWRTGLPAVTRFIAVSEATRSAYIQAGFAPETIDVVYNGIDLQRFTLVDDRQATRAVLGIDPEAFVVIYVGRIDRPKNIEMIIQAFSMLKIPAAEKRLVVVGGALVHTTQEAGEQYVEELRELARSLGIGEQVQWLGRRNDIPELFRAADVSVLPSMLPETFGRSIAESMACGTPAIGVSLGGVPEILTGEFSRYCIDKIELTGMVNALATLQNWQRDDPQLGMRCREHTVERFDAQRMADEVHAVLERSRHASHLRLGPSTAVLKAWHHEGVDYQT